MKQADIKSGSGTVYSRIWKVAGRLLRCLGLGLLTGCSAESNASAMPLTSPASDPAAGPPSGHGGELLANQPRWPELTEMFTEEMQLKRPVEELRAELQTLSGTESLNNQKRALTLHVALVVASIQENNTSASLDNARAVIPLAEMIDSQIPEGEHYHKLTLTSRFLAAVPPQNAGDTTTALALIRPSLEKVEAMHKTSPQDADWDQMLMNAYLSLMEALKAENPDLAEKALRDSMAAVDRLLNAQGGTDPELIYQRTERYRYMGELMVQTKRTTDALNAYNSACANAKALARENPDDFRYQSVVAVSLVEIGDLSLQLNDPEAAVEALVEAVELIQYLGGETSGEDPFLAYALELLYGAYGQTRQWAWSSAASRAALQIRETIATQHPYDTAEAVALANTRRMAASALHAVGAFDESLALSQQITETTTIVDATHPVDHLALEHYCDCWNRIADIHTIQGRISKALPAAQEASRAFQQLAAVSPDNSWRQWAALAAENRLADSLLDAGETSKALRLYRKVHQTLQVRTPPQTNGEGWDEQLIHAQVRIAGILVQQGQTSDALALAGDAVARSEALIAREPELPDNHLVLAAALLSLGSIQAKSESHLDTALQTLEQAVELNESLVASEPDTWWRRDSLTVALSELALLKTNAGLPKANLLAQRILQLTETEPYSDTASTRLSRALALLLLGEKVEASVLAKQLLDQGYRYPPTMELLAQHGILAE